MMTSTIRGIVCLLFLAIFNLNLSAQTTAPAAVYSMPATVHNPLSGTNTPAGIESFDRLRVRVCAGEFEPLSIFLQPKAAVNNVTVKWTDFTGASGSIPASNLDVSIAKVWYQSGVRSTETTKKLLTQELLVKNDNLIKVDYATQKNYLQITNSAGVKSYIDISTPGAVIPAGATVMDSPTLLPFSLDGKTNRQLWFNVHVPDNANPGIYTTEVTINSSNGVLKSFPIEIEVLPFKLDQSRLVYSIYYHGFIDENGYKPFGYTGKTTAQYRVEMKDLRDHGVLYPTSYQSLGSIDRDLTVRKELGFPTERFFSIGMQPGNPQDAAGLQSVKDKVKQWKAKIAQYGYKELYVYGIDEAKREELKSQRQAWNAVHEAGAKVFVAGYQVTFADMGDILDVGNILGELVPEQAKLYHSKGNKIFSYSNPQVGQENPEIYRRNYGLAIWKAGYDGVMNYAYQKFYNQAWNDFDNTRYREETFTYPTSNGIIGTIQWEGFREGVDDVRYLSTLLNKIDALKAQGKDVSAHVNWLNSLDITGDLDQVRGQIIDRILSINETGITSTGGEEITSAVSKFQLDQNYPNPFNPSTTIRFSLPANSHVSLKVFDMLGQQVAMLVNEQRSAGSYEVNFDASHLASGTYVYELRTNNMTLTRKMMLMK